MADVQPREYDISREALGLEESNDKETKISPVAHGRKANAKKPLARRLVEAFVGGDVHDVTRHVLNDVALPALKNMIYDGICEGTERIIYGETGRDRRRNSMHRDYAGYSSKRSEPRRRYDEPTGLNRSPAHSLDEVIFETREEAEDVLGRMFDQLETYKIVTVAELYGLAGISAEYTDERWGWRDLRGSNVQHVRDGFRINLPKPKEL